MKSALTRQLLALGFAVVAIPAQARMIEETVTLQANVRNVRGRQHSHPFQVTIYRDDAHKGRRPFMVLNHGRVTGGPDVEDSGSCKSKIYPPVYEAAAQQSLSVIEHAKAQSYIDPQRGLAVGESFGGTTALTLAAKTVPGVLGAVNFAGGGGGGGPIGHPEQPCRSDLLRELFATYGKTSRIPTL